MKQEQGLLVAGQSCATGSYSGSHEGVIWSRLTCRQMTLSEVAWEGVAWVCVGQRSCVQGQGR